MYWWACKEWIQRKTAKERTRKKIQKFPRTVGMRYLLDISIVKDAISALCLYLVQDGVKRQQNVYKSLVLFNLLV